jgi:hypothetical protein
VTEGGVDAEAKSVIERMSPERLWCRVGVRAATEIERALDRPALSDLIRNGGPGRFVET